MKLLKVVGILAIFLPVFWAFSLEDGSNTTDSIEKKINEPMSKIPFTYPGYSGSFTTYDHKFSEKRDKDYGFAAVNPLFEFGTGLSYTNFEYTGLKLNN